MKQLKLMWDPVRRYAAGAPRSLLSVVVLRALEVR